MTWRHLTPAQQARNRRGATATRAALKPERATPAQAADQARDTPMPPPDMRTTVCRCGGHYLDNQAGHAAHRAVFGHAPEPENRPTEQETTEP